MKISARNVIKGKVKAVTPGTVNTEVIVVAARRRRGRFHHHQSLGRGAGPERR